MLGLALSSSPAWARNATNDLPRLLADHAHCEMKAASSALALSTRAVAHPRVVRELAAIAEEELSHFRSVLAILDARGIPLGPPEADFYVAELLRRTHGSAARRAATDALVDRLLVGALIEARSCERFKLLAVELRLGGGAGTRRGTEEALAAFFEGLLASEARHHVVFVELANEVKPDAEWVRERLAVLQSTEADVVRGLRGEATIHG
jgi:tRNA-(ms[2]io[6]A)-hydroxylase